MLSCHRISIFRTHENAATAFHLSFYWLENKGLFSFQRLMWILQFLYITGKLICDSSTCITKWIFKSNSQMSIMWAAK